MLQAALELARRHYRDTLKTGPALDSPDAARGFLLAQLRDRPYEVFCCMHLNTRHQLIAFEEDTAAALSDGTSVLPMKWSSPPSRAMRRQLILAHNHPSGVAEPSHADELITQRLRDALALVDVRVLDHVIVGDGRCMSFAERGLL